MKEKLKIIPLGGLKEIGKNITVYEYNNEILVVDCGLKFPEEHMLGVDAVIPDFEYLFENSHKIKGLIVTHGHEDHIGAIPHLLSVIDIPIYASTFTIKLIEKKLEQYEHIKKTRLIEVNPDKELVLGFFTIDFIRVTHSIPDALSLCIKTSVGSVIHSGDLKIDYSPIDNMPIDLQKFAELGSKGVLAFLCDSTNSGKPGYTKSEKTVGKTLENILQNDREHRIIIATFSSNIHRVQQIINAAQLFDRKVAFDGRSMISNASCAVETGYLYLPEDLEIDINDIDEYPNNEVLIVTTGSQGEHMSGLSRMANHTHAKVSITENDLIIFSSSPVPGNEKLVSNLMNKLYEHGASVIHHQMKEVHVSGHASREELKLLHSLVKPKFFIPVHGEYTHLISHTEIALEMGMSLSNIFVLNNGEVLEIDADEAMLKGEVQSGFVLTDGDLSSNLGTKILRERQILSREGIVSVSIVLDSELNLLNIPKVITKGFVPNDEMEDIIENAESIIMDKIPLLTKKERADENQIIMTLKNALSNYFHCVTYRRPVILIHISMLELS